MADHDESNPQPAPGDPCANPMGHVVVQSADRSLELGGAFSPASRTDDDGQFTSVACDYGGPALPLPDLGVR